MSNNNGEPIYPILTQKIDANGLPAGGATQGSSLRATVEGTLRQVLGWRPRRDDPKGFSTALQQSFEQIEEGGSKNWVWTPHSYTIQTEMGAVTGAQASIYNRAKVALDQSLPLLNGLTSLRSDSDEEDVDASRAIIESDFTELINELGRTGGPRIQRVDALFESLLGHDFVISKKTDPEIVEGQLGKLRDRLGLNVDGVNTIEEEENLTNFLILADYAISLRQSWLAQVDYFDRRGEDVFLGTQLVWINRALSTLAESVQEARFVLDSLFVGNDERQTIELKLANKKIKLPGGKKYSFSKQEQSLTIAEIFAWIESFTIEEAPRLIRDGGKDGVISLSSSLERIRRLAYAVPQIISKSKKPLPSGLSSKRAKRAFKEIISVVEELYDRVNQIQRISFPNIQSVEVHRLYKHAYGSYLTIVIKGNSFDIGAKVDLMLKHSDDDSELPIECRILKRSSSEILCVPEVIITFSSIRDEAKKERVQLVVTNPAGDRDIYLLQDKDFV